MNEKNVLQRNWTKSIRRENSRVWGIPERDPCMKMEENNLVENLQCTKEEWWRFPITRYCIKMITQKIKSHDERRSSTWICSIFPTMIYSIVHEAFTENQCSRLKYIWNQALHYPWWSLESRKWCSSLYNYVDATEWMVFFCAQDHYL